MARRRRALLLSASLVLVGLVAASIWWLLRPAKQAVEPPSEWAAYQDWVKKKVEKEREDWERYANATTDAERQQALRAAPRLEAAIRLSEAAIHPISLFGQVVDDEGTGVPGATVMYYAGGALGAQGTGRGMVVTDARGHFEVTGARGGSLDIRGIHKPGYDRIWGQQHTFWPGETSQMGPGWLSCTAASRCKFVLAKMPDGYVAGSEVRHRTTGRDLGVGDVYTLDLLAPGSRRRQWQRGESAKGQLTVSLGRAEGDEPAAKLELRVVAKNGGFQRATGLAMTSPPTAGYVREITLPVLHDDTIQHVFLMHREPLQYARLSFKFVPLVDPDGTTLMLAFTYDRLGRASLPPFGGFGRHEGR